MFKFQRIWSIVVENADERARNLFASCSEHLFEAEYGTYLDVGFGLGHNTIVFGANAAEIVALDRVISVDNVLKKKSNSHLVIGDAANLPFRDRTADMISSFSVIEYINPDIHVRELYRVLKFNGTLIIQFPNRYFLIELCMGIPLFYFVPTRIRNFIVKGTKYDAMKTEFKDVPSIKRVAKILSRITQEDDITIKKVSYSPLIILPKLRILYSIILKTRLFDLMPLGYIVILRKKNQNS